MGILNFHFITNGTLMKYLYIDTNIYLNMYKFNTSTYTSLYHILNLLNENLIKLYIPEQTKNEFMRHRVKIINETMKKFKKSISTPEIPVFIKKYDQTRIINIHHENIKTNVKIIEDLVDVDIKNTKLEIDGLIDKLFNHSNVITKKMTPELYTLGDIRVKCGNPPGKPNSHGDAYNWECILDDHYGDDLHIISADSDYYTSKNSNDIHPYIKSEFNELNPRHDIKIYHKPSEFLMKIFHDHCDSSEITLNAYIDVLTNASSFTNTKHEIDNMITNIDNIKISTKFITGITQAYITNNQINLISSDTEVQSLIKLIDDNLTYLSSDIQIKYDRVKTKSMNN